ESALSWHAQETQLGRGYLCEGASDRRGAERNDQATGDGSRIRILERRGRQGVLLPPVVRRGLVRGVARGAKGQLRRRSISAQGATGLAGAGRLTTHKPRIQRARADGPGLFCLEGLAGPDEGAGDLSCAVRQASLARPETAGDSDLDAIAA